MTKHEDVVTEALNRHDDEIYYGDLYRRGQRVVFVYDDLNKVQWDTRLECFGPATVRRVYPNLLAFTRDWQITAQVPYGR